MLKQLSPHSSNVPSPTHARATDVKLVEREPLASQESLAFASAIVANAKNSADMTKLEAQVVVAQLEANELRAQLAQVQVQRAPEVDGRDETKARDGIDKNHRTQNAD